MKNINFSATLLPQILLAIKFAKTLNGTPNENMKAIMVWSYERREKEDKNFGYLSVCDDYDACKAMHCQPTKKQKELKELLNPNFDWEKDGKPIAGFHASGTDPDLFMSYRIEFKEGKILFKVTWMDMKNNVHLTIFEETVSYE